MTNSVIFSSSSSTIYSSVMTDSQHPVEAWKSPEDLREAAHTLAKVYPEGEVRQPLILSRNLERGSVVCPRGFQFVSFVVFALTLVHVIFLFRDKNTSSETPKYEVSTIARDWASDAPTVIAAMNGTIYIADSSHVYRMRSTQEDEPTLFAGAMIASKLRRAHRLTTSFVYIRAIAVDQATGDLYVGDQGDGTVRKIRSRDGFVVDVVGGGVKMDGVALEVMLGSIAGVTVNPLTGHVLVVDRGPITAGVGQYDPDSKWFSRIPISGLNGVPEAISIGATTDNQTSSLYLSLESAVGQLHSSASKIFILAGSRSTGFANGVGSAARFEVISGLAFASHIGTKGALLAADKYNHCIRMIDIATATVTTFAGRCGESGSGNGFASEMARFLHPQSITADGHAFYVTDGDAPHSRLRKIAMVEE